MSDCAEQHLSVYVGANRLDDDLFIGSIIKAMELVEK